MRISRRGAALVLALAAGCYTRDGAYGPPNPLASEGASGSKAVDYLADARFTSLFVEVDFEAGAQPDAAALSLLETRLRERCQKLGGIVVQLGDQIPAQGVATWTLAQVRGLEKQYRSQYAYGAQAVLYFLFVAGGYEGDGPGGRVLGVSHTGSSICIFKDGIREASMVQLTQVQVEKAVLVHEAGHNLGLVDNGIAMQTPHEDASHPAHDTSTSCVMYYAVESSLVAQLMPGGVPDQFDRNCLADCAAAGGK